MVNMLLFFHKTIPSILYVLIKRYFFGIASKKINVLDKKTKLIFPILYNKICNKKKTKILATF